jgi:hypothetical protein
MTHKVQDSEMWRLLKNVSPEPQPIEKLKLKITTKNQ